MSDKDKAPDIPDIIVELPEDDNDRPCCAYFEDDRDGFVEAPGAEAAIGMLLMNETPHTVGWAVILGGRSIFEGGGKRVRITFKKEDDQLIPAEVFHPGSLISEELEERSWTVEGLAMHLGRPVEFVQELIGGARDVTADVAEGLAKVFHTDAGFWMRFQARWDSLVYNGEETK